MTTEERRNSLEEMLREKKEVDVNTIREAYGVSSVTVRNDLMYLERKGIIRRLFGKAILREDGLSDMINPFLVENLDKKEKIGRLAVSMIEPGDSIMLFAGTTTLQIARQLDASVNLIAVTNSIYIAHELRRFPRVKTILLGGNMSRETGVTYGICAVEQLNNYNIDKLFLSLDGIDAENGLTNRYPDEAELNLALIRKAGKIIVAADGTKVGKVNFIQIGSVKDVDVLITDFSAPPEQVSAIRKKGVTVFQV